MGRNIMRIYKFTKFAIISKLIIIAAMRFEFSLGDTAPLHPS